MVSTRAILTVILNEYNKTRMMMTMMMIMMMMVINIFTLIDLCDTELEHNISSLVLQLLF